MCGRYVSKSAATNPRFKDLRGLPGSPFHEEPRLLFDARPTQTLPYSRVSEDGAEEMTEGRWGLVPVWWKEEKLPAKTFNATAEKIKAKSGMWWTPFLRQRCLVPAWGFYEWQLQPDGKTKVRHYIKPKDGDLFTFAGLWNLSKLPDGTELHSFTIVTCPANGLMAKIHNNPQNSEGPRMPVILSGETAKAWADPAVEMSPQDRLELLKPFAPEAMVAYPVVSSVTKGEDAAKLIEPIGEEVTA